MFLNNLFALKSYYINKRVDLKNFDNLQITLIIKSGKRLFFSKKNIYLSINKKNFKKSIKKSLL